MEAVNQSNGSDTDESDCEFAFGESVFQQSFHEYQYSPSSAIQSEDTGDAQISKNTLLPAK